MPEDDPIGLIQGMISSDDREKFRRTFLGSLLGQSLVFLTVMTAYLSALGLLYRNFNEDFSQAREAFGSVLFTAGLLAPAIVIFFFSILPAALQVRRERQLRRLALVDVAPVADWFRLHPYTAADRDRYRRVDQADQQALAWIRDSQRTLLYLSGASGTGKSSLLGAALLPQLRDAGWDCVETRINQNPEAQLRAALLRISIPATGSDSAELSLDGLLRQAGQARLDAGRPPLLLVIDQFEEFLLLNDPAARAPLLAVLQSLDSTPAAGLRLLCVFRSDYRPLLFKHGLPDYLPGTGGFELSPFTRREAEAFLRDGGRILSDEGYQALFRGLDGIDEAPGLYRPITLNMVGLVMARMAGRLDGDPSALIDSYLRHTVTRGPSRDFAPVVLRPMITTAGTKAPRRLDELTADTRLKPWQVKSTLVDLERDGLVRPLTADRTIWEISHDFLARRLGLLVARLRPGWVRRSAPLALGLVLVLWITGMFVVLDYLPQLQEIEARYRLEQLGAVIPAPGTLVMMPREYGERVIREGTILNRSLTENADLVEIISLVGALRTPIRNFSAADTNISNLEPLQGIPLTSIDLSNADGISSLEPLQGMPLTSIDLSDADGISSLEPLQGMPLTSIDLSYADGISSLEPLRGMPLTSINLSFARGITSLEPLRGMPLTSIDLRSVDGITSLEPLRGMPLTSIDLSSVDGITSLEPLRGMPLTSIDLRSVDGITSLEPLRGMPLRWIFLNGDTGITSLEPLKDIPDLRIDGVSDKLRATLR